MPKVKNSQPNDAWQELIDQNSDKPVVYFFSSESCPFCVRAKPYLEVLQDKYRNLGVEVIVVDVDAQQDVALAANVQNFPQYKFVFGKKLVGSAVGWEPAKRMQLEKELGLSKQYGLEAGLARSPEELEAIKSDPDTSVGVEEYEEAETASGCGDSTQQVAEIAAGMDEALTKIDNKLRSILARLDAIESRFAPLSDDIMAAVGTKPESGSKCKCGKHKED